jgi:hypothetical protein
VLDDGLADTAVSGGWHLMTIEALAVGAFVVAMFLIWDRTRLWERTRRIDTRLRRTEKVTYLFEMHGSRHLLIKLNSKSGMKAAQYDTEEKTSADNVTELALSPATSAGQLEDGQSADVTIPPVSRA